MPYKHIGEQVQTDLPCEMHSLPQIPIKRNVAIVGFTIFATAILGFLINILVAYYFGASSTLDAFFVAFLVLFVIQNEFQSGDIVNATFIPIYNLALSKGVKKTQTFFSASLLSIMILFSFLAVISALLAPSFITLLGPGLSPEAKALAVRIFRIFSLLFPFVGLTSVLAPTLRAQGSFFTPTAGPLVINVSIIITLLVLTREFGIMSFVYGWVLGCTLQFLVVISPLFRTPRFSIKYISWQDEYVVKFFRRFGLMCLDIPVGFLILALERSMASSISPGTISHLNYARVIYAFGLRLMAIPLHTVMFSRFAQYVALGDTITFKKQIVTSFRLTLALILPVSVLIICLREQIVLFLFQRGAFVSTDTTQTSTILLYFGISMPGIASWWLLRRVSHALGDVVSPILSSLPALGLYFIGNCILIPKMGSASLPFNWAVSFTLAAVLLATVMKHKLENGLLRNVTVDLLKTVTAAGTAALFFLILPKYSHDFSTDLISKWPIFWYILQRSLAYSSFYLLLAWFFGIPEVARLPRQIKRKYESLTFFR